MTMKTDEESSKPKLYVRVEPMHIPSRSANPKLSCLAHVNDDLHPILVHNEHFTGHIVFRVRHFRGWTPLDERTGKPKPPIPDCPHYFEGHKRTFSLQISGRFRKQWSGDDIMFGTFFRKRIELPRGSGLALAFAQRIDPSMEYEANCDHPYICSPILCAMNTVHIQPLLAPNPASRQSAVSSPRASLRRSLFETAVLSQEDRTRPVTEPLTLPEWTYGGKHEILEENLLTAWPSWTLAGGGVASKKCRSSNTSLAATDSDIHEDSHSRALLKAVSKNKTGASHRRQWFLDERNRKRFAFHPDTVYSFDFASPYVDMNEITLKMGISIPVTKYLDGQPVRYECRSRDGKVLFFAIELGLL